LKIFFAAAEAVPFCKTGGLGDVAGSLASALGRHGHEVRLFLPKYRSLGAHAPPLKKRIPSFTVSVAGRKEKASVWEARLGPSVAAWLLDMPALYDRDGDPYRDVEGTEHPDNDERYIAFCRGAMEACRALRFAPDILHAHDWQGGLIAPYAKTLYARDPAFKNAAAVFSVHNIAYQGIFSKATFVKTGLSWEEFTYDKMEFHDHVNFLKAGLAYSEMITTVSPAYADEVRKDEEAGRGMAALLRSRPGDFVGILNGLDEKEWDPERDGRLARPFSGDNLDPRQVCKADLQRALGLAENPRAPLLGMVSRIDPQKGFDMALNVIGLFLREGAQLAVLGRGDAGYTAALAALARRFTGSVALCTEFNEDLAHKIYGGADLFLMPSRFEPCGLGQMIALRYGAVPVVTPTGGLKDTVAPVRPRSREGVGFVASAVSEAAFARALGDALALYRGDPTGWKALMRRGMALRFGWDASVVKYGEVFVRALAKKRGKT
jgi:starch synthase